MKSILRGERMGFHTSLARSVVRMVEAADRSLTAGGREVTLDRAGIADQLDPRRELALA